MSPNVTIAEEYWNMNSNLYQFEEGDPEHLMNKEDFLNFAQQSKNAHDKLIMALQDANATMYRWMGSGLWNERDHETFDTIQEALKKANEIKDRPSSK